MFLVCKVFNTSVDKFVEIEATRRVTYGNSTLLRALHYLCATSAFPTCEEGTRVRPPVYKRFRIGIQGKKRKIKRSTQRSQHFQRVFHKMFQGMFRECFTRRGAALARKQFHIEFPTRHIVGQATPLRFIEFTKARPETKLFQTESCLETRCQYHFGGRSRWILMLCLGSVMSNQRP